MTDWLNGIGLGLGLLGGLLDSKGVAVLINASRTYDGTLADVDKRRARWWLYPGMAGIVAAFGLQLVALLVG